MKTVEQRGKRVLFLQFYSLVQNITSICYYKLVILLLLHMDYGNQITKTFHDFILRANFIGP